MTLHPCETAVACPTCGAQPGNVCRGVFRIPLEPHRSRRAHWANSRCPLVPGCVWCENGWGTWHHDHDTAELAG